MNKTCDAWNFNLKRDSKINLKHPCNEGQERTGVSKNVMIFIMIWAILCH